MSDDLRARLTALTEGAEDLIAHGAVINGDFDALVDQLRALLDGTDESQRLCHCSDGVEAEPHRFIPGRAFCGGYPTPPPKETA